MKVKFKFILFTIAIHLTLLIFSFQILDYEKKRFLFLVAEFLILCSIVISYKLYRSFIRPLEIISLGVESIKSKDFNTKFVKVGHSELDQLVEMYNGMIDVLRSERSKQQEQHFFLNRLIDASPMGVLILNFENEIYQLNPSAINLIGIDEKSIHGKKIDSTKSELLIQLSKLQDNKSKLITLSNGKKYRCQKSYFVDQGFERFFIVFDEVTEELISAEKASYEKIIRVMAHEVNNSVSAVNSILSSFKNFSTFIDEKDREDYLNAIDISAERNDKLIMFVKRYADFVKLPSPILTKNDFVELIQSVSSLMSKQMSDRMINFVFVCEHKTCFKQFDVNLMEHVLMNIFKNAIEAIENNGEIKVILTDRELIVEDSGSGISSEVEGKLFTPFFTTKEDGNGIGLILIRDILMNHTFDFSLTSNKNSTIFRIIFNQ